MRYLFKSFLRCARPFHLKQSIRKGGIYWNIFHAAHAALIIWWKKEGYNNCSTWHLIIWDRCDAKWRFQRKTSALESTQCFQTKFMESDLDEMIDFWSIQPRDLSYFIKRKFWGRSWWNYRFSNMKITWPDIVKRNLLVAILLKWPIFKQ